MKENNFPACFPKRSTVIKICTRCDRTTKEGLMEDAEKGKNGGSRKGFHE